LRTRYLVFGRTTGTTRRASSKRQPYGFGYGRTFSISIAPQNNQASLSCILTFSPRAYTFTKREARLINPSPTEFLSEGFRSVDYDYAVRIRDAEDISGGGGVLERGEMAEIRWNSVNQEERRDIILIAIGVLFAVGAATLVEAVRPYVDRLD
jgi:hypothetical protein